MVTGREIAIGIPVKESQRYTPIRGDLVFCIDVRQELERGGLYLLGSITEVEGAAHIQGQLLIHETFTDGEVQVGAIQGHLALILVIKQITAVVQGCIEIDPDALVIKDML